MRLTIKLMHTADAALKSIESMRQDPLWIPVIAGLKDHAWCKGNKEAAADFTHLLRGTGRIGNLSAAVAQRVQACLLPLVSKFPELCIRLHLMHEGCFSQPCPWGCPEQPCCKMPQSFNMIVVFYCREQPCVCCVVGIALLLPGRCMVGAGPRWGWSLL